MQPRDNKWGIPIEVIVWIGPPIILVLIAILASMFLPAISRHRQKKQIAGDGNLQTNDIYQHEKQMK